MVHFCVTISEKLLTGADVRIPMFVNYLLNILVFFGTILVTFCSFGGHLGLQRGSPLRHFGIPLAPLGPLGAHWALTTLLVGAC